MNEVVLPDEWKENFRMGRAFLYKLMEELRTFIEGKVTRIRAPVDVVKLVALTVYYLSDRMTFSPQIWTLLWGCSVVIAQNAIVFRDMYLQFSGRQNNLHV